MEYLREVKGESAQKGELSVKWFYVLIFVY